MTPEKQHTAFFLYSSLTFVSLYSISTASLLIFLLLNPLLFLFPPSRLVVKQSSCRPAFPGGTLMATLRHSDVHKHSTTKWLLLPRYLLYSVLCALCQTLKLLFSCMLHCFVSSYNIDNLFIFSILLCFVKLHPHALVLLLLLLCYILATSPCFHHRCLPLKNSSSLHWKQKKKA